MPGRYGFFIPFFKNDEMAFDELVKQNLTNWQGRKEWFFNREHTDTYELWYEGRYKRAEIFQKKLSRIGFKRTPG